MKYIQALLLLLSFTNLRAQDLILKIESDTKFEYSYKKIIKTEAEAEKEIQKVIRYFYSEGYLSAYPILLEKNEKNIAFKIEAGSRFMFGKIRKGNAEEEVLNKIGYREKIYFGKSLNEKNIASLAEKVIHYYESNGYPFASFMLDSIHIKNGEFTASLKITKNQFYKIDSIVLKGESKLKKAYIENYIGIKSGDIYNENLIQQIDKKIKELAFAESIKPAEIVFSKTQCYIYIYLNEKKASNFNGVLGILPDNNTGKITFTGDVRIRLKNTLHSGELFDLNWRKLNNDIQDLNININYPFLFKSNFGTDLLFKLYKKDTTFLELNQNAGLLYMLRSGNFLKISVNYQSSVLLNPEMFENTTVLPEFADVNSLLYGIGSKIEKLDYRLNPTRGYSIGGEIRVGNKTIKKNPFLNELIYENLKLKTLKYYLNLNGELYYSFIKRTTLKIANQTGWIENENLFMNELFRIGGLRTLRGFNEESIFASFYSISTLEFRFLLEQNSNIYVFFDQTYYERKMQNGYFHDLPYGFGAGISFQTGAGIFSMNYALGSEQGNPIQFRGAKIHFGFVNYF